MEKSWNFVFEFVWEPWIQYVNSSDRVNTIFKHRHAWVSSENVINQLIFREKVLDLRPESVCAVETTKYVQCMYVSLNRKDVHASMISFNGKDMY